MSSKRSGSQGFTLIEMIVAIVVLGLGITGVMMAYTHSARGPADAVVQRPLLGLAQGLLDEALSKPFHPVPGGGTSSCDRTALNDVSDYNGYSGRVCDVHGIDVAGFSGYTVDVSVQDVSLAGAPAKLVTVRAQRGADALELQGWRVDTSTP